MEFLEKIDATPIVTIEQKNKNNAIEKAAENISLVSNKKLDKPEIAYLLKLLGEGCTVQTIKRRFKNRFDRGLTNNTIYRYRHKYASKLADYSLELEHVALNEGLARRSIRIDKLSKLSEAIEDHIYDEEGEFVAKPDPKLIKEYRESLTQIAKEVGDMPTDRPDMTFINMSDEDLKTMVAQKLAANKDMAVILAEKAGVRAQPELLDSNNEVINGQD